MKPLSYALAFTIALSAGFNVSGQQLAYTSIDFPGATSTSAWGINSHGDVVGVYTLPDTSVHGFLFSGGEITSLDYPGAATTHTWGINDHGEIVGDYTIGGVMHGFLLSNGRFSNIDYPGSIAGGPAAINNSGQIAGAYTAPDNSFHSFQLAGSRFTNLDFPGATSNQGNGINSLGDVVSNYTLNGVTHGLVVSNGKFTTIDVPGAAFTGAYGIDPAGNIVGRTRDAAGVTHGFLLSGGKFTMIDIPGATATAASVINVNGDIAGRYTAGGISHGFVLTSPAVSYTITDLGTLPGGSFSQASQGNTDNGLIAGVSDTPDGAQHAILWYRGLLSDLATTGLGGPNSFSIALNSLGQVVGQAETSVKDTENFCLYGTGLQCLPFFWRNGIMSALPTLGGPNGAVSSINKHGLAVGLAQNNTVDPACPAPITHSYKAVAWGPGPGQIRELRPLPGDTVAVAFWINDAGQSVGTSGLCSNTTPNGVIVGPHAVLWDADGSVVDLGNLGGSVDTSLTGVGNSAIFINNRGEVVGGSALPGNTTAHPFLWTKDAGIKDLGLLPGDFRGGALAINDRGEVVGISNDSEGNPHPFVWRDGVMSDLNELASADSPLYLLLAFGINTRGEIVGLGVTGDGDAHAFLATPSRSAISGSSMSSRQPVVSERVRRQLEQRMRLGWRNARGR